VPDHFAAEQERFEGFEDVPLAVEPADAGRAREFMPGEREEIRV